MSAAFQEAVTNLQIETKALRFMLEEVQKKVENQELLLVKWDDNQLPLAEIVRNLTNTVSNYIAQKDKEEQKRADIEKAKKAEWNRLKWIIIGFAVPALLVFISQAFIFFFRIFPLLEKLSQWQNAR